MPDPWDQMGEPPDPPTYEDAFEVTQGPLFGPVSSQTAGAEFPGGLPEGVPIGVYTGGY